MDVHAVKSAAAYVVMLAFLLAAKGTTAQLCFNASAACASNYLTLSGSGTAFQCCVSFIGYSYTSSSASEGCNPCIVYGFLNGTTNTGIQLNSITIKQGDPGVPVSFSLLRGTLPNSRSFTITSSNTQLYIPTTLDKLTQFFTPFVIKYTLKVALSNVALETPKMFTLSATLSSSSGNEFTAPLTVTVLPVNILNIQFTDTVYTVVEGTNKSARLLLRRTQSIEQPLQLRVTPLTLAEAEARNITLPADAWKNPSIYPASYAGDRKQFINTPQIVSFTTSGSNEIIPVQIAILDDGIIGPDVQFVCIVELVNQSFASAVNISSPVTLVRIIDNDVAVLGFLTDNTMVTEGQLFNICVAITSPPPQLFLWPLNSSFLIQLTIVPLTAGVRDIGKDNASLAIVGPFNDARRFYCLQLTAVADRVLQGTRSLNLTASLYGVAQPLLTISPNTTTVTIIDSTQIVIGFTQTQYTVTRKDSYVTFNVSILGGATIQGASVGVMFSTGDGTALAGADYDARTQLLVFNNTVTQLPIVVTIKDDGVVKYTDVYFGASLTLQSARGFERLITLNPHQTNVTIKDDHVLVIGFDPVVYSANVNGDSVAITVKVLQGSLAVPVSIRVFTEDGTATSGSDYVATSQSVVFDSSSTNHTVTIQLINKLVSDASKVFSVGLSVETPEAKGRVTLSPSVANVTIVNTNVAVIGFVAGVYSVRKSEGSVSMMVGLLQGQLGAPVTVTFSTYSGTATAGLDFTQTTLPLVFNNTVTQLPIIVTIKDDGVFKYTDVYFGASLTLQSARGFEHLITLNPHQTNVTIKDDHVLVIGFDPVVYSANVNGDSVAITVKVLQGSLAVPVSIRVFTEDGTATSGSDYVATSQSVVFDSSSTNHTVTIQLINKLVSDASKMFSVGLSVETPEAKGRVTLSPSVANVTVQGVLQNIEVNDSMIADPLFTVPLNVHSELFPALSLCYEIHGQPRQYYNLVSDTCTSVNARYNASLNGVGVNIIDDITVRAVDRAGQCVDIEVDVDCGVSVGGSRVQIYSLNEVYVRTYGNSSVRISVPNCNHQQLVMWILCQVRPIEDPITGKKFSAKMQKFVVTRGLSLGENSHGIIAQFWGVQASVTKYNGSYSVAPYPGSAYYILTMQSGGKSRSVLSSVYKFTWERLGGPCLYAGDGEAGWMVGGNLSNDLIDGQPDDYIVSSAFETNFKYSRFTQSCPDRLH